MRSPENPMLSASRVRKSRFGCLGCLPRLVGIVVAGVVILLLATAMFTPWGFYLGGKFHIIPEWQGWGRLHSKSAGDYVLFVRMWPNSVTRLGNAYFSGVGYICTPRGEEIRLKLMGTMGKHPKPSIDGEPIRLGMYHRSYWVDFTGERRPSFELRGRWQNPNLVMDDNGSLARAFQPDGSVYLGHDPYHPYAHEIVPVTLNEGSYSEFEVACTAKR